MDNRVRSKATDDTSNRLVVAQVTHEQLQRSTGHFLPGLHAIVKGKDGDQRFNIELHLPAPLGKVVQDPDPVATVGQIHCRRPAKVTVSTKNENVHGLGPPTGKKVKSFG